MSKYLEFGKRDLIIRGRYGYKEIIINFNKIIRNYLANFLDKLNSKEKK